MCKKRIFSLLAVIIAMCFAATAVQADWTNAAGNNLWEDPNNWSDEEVPDTSNVALDAAAEPDDYVFIGPEAGTGYPAEWEWPDNLASVNNMRFGDDPADPQDPSVASHVIVDGAMILRDYDVAYDPDTLPHQDPRYARIFIIGQRYPAVMDVNDGWILSWHNLFIGGAPQDNPGGDGTVNLSGKTYWQLQRQVIGHPTETNYGELNILGDNVLMRTNIGGEGAGNNIGSGDGHGTLNMHGGYMHYGDESVSVGTNGVINLYGGTIYVESGDLDIADGGQIRFQDEDAQLIVAGDVDVADGMIAHFDEETGEARGVVESEFIEDYNPNDWYPAVWDPNEIPYATEGQFANVARDVTIFSAAELDLDQPWDPAPTGTLVGNTIFEPLTLSWNPGDTAKTVEGQDVYFGSDADEVAEATVETDGIYKGRQSETEYDVAAGTMELDETYYWRVDQINEDQSITTGPVWSFSIGEFLMIDDFDAYEDTAELLQNWSAEGTATVEQESDWFDGDPHHMLVKYNNSLSPYYAEATIDAQDMLISDWNEYDMAFLAIGFWDPEGDNDAEPMYLKVSDGENTAVSWYKDEDGLTDPNATTYTGWQFFPMPFAEMQDEGVDIENIESLSIGIGDSAEAGGAGEMLIQYARIYPAGCYQDDIAWADHYDADFYATCTVDFEDFAFLAMSWLQSEYTVTAEDPGTEGLITWYKFDELVAPEAEPTWVDFVVDSVEPENEDRWLDLYEFLQWNHGEFHEDGGPDGAGSVEFYGSDDELGKFNVPTDFGISDVNEAVTVTHWAKGSDDLPGDDGAVSFWGAHRETDARQTFRNALVTTGGAIRWQSDTGLSNNSLIFDASDETELWQGQWNHYAFVADTSGGEDNMRLAIYINGILIDEMNNANLDLTDTDSFGLGGPDEGRTHLNYQGEISDFRIYNKALSHEEIVYLASETSVVQPLEGDAATADIDESGQVDYADLEYIVNEWLEDLTWP